MSARAEMVAELVAAYNGCSREERERIIGALPADSRKAFLAALAREDHADMRDSEASAAARHVAPWLLACKHHDARTGFPFLRSGFEPSERARNALTAALASQDADNVRIDMPLKLTSQHLAPIHNPPPSFFARLREWLWPKVQSDASMTAQPSIRLSRRPDGKGL
ncbi:MAG: hypothetical protein AAFX04_10720 [Pseudomonadota bacterium]